MNNEWRFIMELEYLAKCFENGVGFSGFTMWITERVLEFSFDNYIQYCKWVLSACLSERESQLLEIY